MNRRVFLKQGLGVSAGLLATGFLMYPQGETDEGRKDSLDPASFRYTITSREITG